MAREQNTRTADRESTRGFEPQRRYAQHADDRHGENDDVSFGRERAWQQGPDDWNGPYNARNRSSEDQYQGDGYQRDRGRSETFRDRQRGQSDWEPYDRNPTNYSQRNDQYGQADGGGFGAYDSQYGQNYSRNYGQNYGEDYGSPMHRQSNSAGYRSQGGRTVAPTNGPWRGMQDNQYYGDTQGDNYGGGGYMRNRENRSRGQDSYYSQNRRDSGNYGSEFMEDGFGSLRNRQREGNGYSNGYSNSQSSGYGSADSQNFSGRGPKGWKRSDERIQEELSEQLERHWNLDASEIEVKVKEGEVTLSGTTSDRHMKRLAEDIADQVAGVREVQNQIRVQRADDARDSDRKSNADSSESKQQGRKSTPMTS